MNNNEKRIIVAGGIAIIVLTILFLALEKTGIVISAYCFSLLATIAFCGTLWLIASGVHNKYITNVAFLIQARSYAILNLLISIIFVLLEQIGVWRIPTIWFCILQILLLAFFAWRFIAMDAGQEEIERVEKKVKLKTTNWKIIEADVIALKETANPESVKEIQDVIDAIHYADPMSCPELESLDEAIKENVLLLELNLKNQKYDEISLICLKLQKQIKDRNTRSKILK